jgi:hypothetical protein
MRKLMFAAFLIACLSAPAFADTKIELPTGFGQDQFKDLSRDLGLAISYVPLSPAEPLGDKLPGFDIGVEVTAVQLDTNKAYWQAIENNPVNKTDIPSTLVFPKLHAQIGFPFVPIDIGFVYSKIPGTNITYTGGEIKYAILEGNVALPALAIRGAYTKLSGVSDLDISTKYADLSISKGIFIFTPYAGYALVWIDSKEKSDLVTLDDVSLTEGKAFLGCKITFFPLMNMVLEADFAKVNSYSARLNLSF